MLNVLALAASLITVPSSNLPLSELKAMTNATPGQYIYWSDPTFVLTTPQKNTLASWLGGFYSGPAAGVERVEVFRQPGTGAIVVRVIGYRATTGANVLTMLANRDEIDIQGVAP